jgi:hypothetical protein
MNEFEEQIKEWVSIDNQIRLFNEKLKSLREIRNNKNDRIMQYIEENNLSNASINISDGKLRFTKSRHIAPITLKYVEDCLSKCIKNKEQVDIVMKVIKESRNIQYTSDIKRTYMN